MKVYNAFLKIDHQTPMETTTFIREGFSLWGFIFTAFWLLYHKAWLPAAVIFAANITLSVLEMQGITTIAISMALQLGVSALVGFAGHDWIAHSLSKRGYSLVDIVTGRDIEDAQQRFFTRYTEESLAPLNQSNVVPAL